MSELGDALFEAGLCGASSVSAAFVYGGHRTSARMPSAAEPALPTDVDDFDACPNAVHAVIGERTAVGATREVRGHALLHQTSGALPDVAGPETDVIEPGSPRRVPGTARRPLDELDERRPARAEDDAVVPFAEPVGRSQVHSTRPQPNAESPASLARCPRPRSTRDRRQSSAHDRAPRPSGTGDERQAERRALNRRAVEDRAGHGGAGRGQFGGDGGGAPCVDDDRRRLR